MSDTIILNLPYPVSANHYKGERIVPQRNPQTGKVRYISMRYLTEEAKAFIAECQRVALAAGLPEPLTGRIELAFRLYPQRPQDWAARKRKLGPEWDDDVRCMDGFNAEKVMADALQGIVYANDKQVWRGQWERCEPDEYGARLVVYVRKIPPKTVGGISTQTDNLPQQEALL